MDQRRRGERLVVAKLAGISHCVYGTESYARGAGVDARGLGHNTPKKRSTSMRKTCPNRCIVIVFFAGCLSCYRGSGQGEERSSADARACVTLSGYCENFAREILSKERD